jgi:hypothetical protein
MNNLENIYNNNTKNISSDNNYLSFNDFIFSNDIKILGKLLYRFKFFEQTKHLAGDIVELGVFKGSGVATFVKFLEIYCPNSNKKIIGFDIFDTIKSNKILDKYGDFDKNHMNIVYSRVKDTDLSLDSVNKRLENMNINKKYILVEGDVEETLPKFLEENPGFRISMLYIDVDLKRPTYNGLKYLWDRILPGGIILFDEYEYHKFSESDGVEQFLNERNINYDIKSTNWMCPTAYLIKK